MVSIVVLGVNHVYLMNIIFVFCSLSNHNKFISYSKTSATYIWQYMNQMINGYIYIYTKNKSMTFIGSNREHDRVKEIVHKRWNKIQKINMCKLTIEKSEKMKEFGLP